LAALKTVQLVGVPIIDISPLLELPKLEKVTVQALPLARMGVLEELERRGVTVKR
jgi:hypothetical protein